MEVITGTISDTMNTSTASATPQEEVDGLIQQVADENQLDLMDTLDEVRPPGQAQEAKKKKKWPPGTTTPGQAQEAKAGVSKDDDLAARLEALRT